MPSAVNALLPLAETPFDKDRDLKDVLEAVRRELDHGGFAAGNQTTAAALAGLRTALGDVEALRDRVASRALQVRASVPSAVPGGGTGTTLAVARGVDRTVDLRALLPDAVAFRIVRGPVHGRLGRDEMATIGWMRGERATRHAAALEPGGDAVRYRPNFAFTGTDLFAFIGTDAEGADLPPVTVTLTVTAPGRPEVIADPTVLRARCLSLKPGDRVLFRPADPTQPVDLGLIEMRGPGAPDTPAIVELDAVVTGSTRFFLHDADQHVRGGEWRDAVGQEATESQGRLIVLGGDRCKCGDALMTRYKGGAAWQNAILARPGKADCEVADWVFANPTRSTVSFSASDAAGALPIRPRLLDCKWSGATSETGALFQWGTSVGTGQAVLAQNRQATYAFGENLVFEATRTSSAGGDENGSLKNSHLYLLNVLLKDGPGAQGLGLRFGGEHHVRNLVGVNSGGIWDCAADNSSLVNVYWESIGDFPSSRISDETFTGSAGDAGATFTQPASGLRLAHFTYVTGTRARPALATGATRGDRFGAHAVDVAIQNGIIDAAVQLRHVEGAGTTATPDSPAYKARVAFGGNLSVRALDPPDLPGTVVGDPRFVTRTWTIRTARGESYAVPIDVPTKGGAADGRGVRAAVYFPVDLFGAERPDGACTAGCAEAITAFVPPPPTTPTTPTTPTPPTTPAHDSPADWPELQHDPAYHVTLTPSAPLLLRDETASAGDSDYLRLVTLGQTFDALITLARGNGVTDLYLYQADSAGVRGALITSTEGLTPPVISRRLPAGRYYLGAYTASGAGATYDVDFTVEVPPAQEPIAPVVTRQVAKDTTTRLDLLSSAASPDGSALSLTAAGPPEASSSTVALVAGTGAVNYTTVGYTGADRFPYTVTTARGKSTTSRVEVAVLSQPPTALGFTYGFNSARDIYCRTPAELRTALGDATRVNMHKVVPTGTTLSGLGQLTLNSPGQTIRAETRLGATLAAGTRFYVQGNGDRTTIYGFRWPTGSKNAYGTGSHVMFDGCSDCLAGDIYGKDLRANNSYDHLFSAINDASRCTYRGLLLFNIGYATAGGQMGAYPTEIRFEDSWFVDCGIPSNRQSLVLQFNQGGEDRYYPDHSENPAWRNSRSAAIRCHLIRMSGFASQFKVGGGVYSECLITGKNANSPNNFQTQDFWNARDGEGQLVEKCVVYGTFEGFLMQAQKGILRDSVIINPGYAGMRMWLGGRVADTYAPNHGWNETLPSLENKVYGNTFDLGPHPVGGSVARAMTFDTSGEPWNQQYCRDNEFRNNIWMMNSSGAPGCNDPRGNNRWADNLFWSRNGRFNGSIPAHVKNLRHADPKIVRINKTYVIPESGERYTVPIPYLGAGSAAIGVADPAYVAAKDIWGVTRGGTDLFNVPRGTSPNLGALQTVV